MAGEVEGPLHSTINTVSSFMLVKRQDSVALEPVATSLPYNGSATGENVMIKNDHVTIL